MVITLGLDVKANNSGLQSTVKGLQEVENQAKRTKKATEEVSDAFSQTNKRTGELADTVGKTATKLARSAEAFNLPVGALRTLDDVMDVAELGFGNLTKSMAGFNAASVGVAGAGLAIGAMIGGWLNTFPAVQRTVDAAAASLWKFFGVIDPDKVANATAGLAQFRIQMSNSNDAAMRKQIGQLRASGMKDTDIAKMYEGKLSPALREELNLTEKSLEAWKNKAKAAEKYKNDLAEVNRIFKGENRSLVELYKAGTSVSSKDFAKMLPGIATTFSPGEQVRGAGPQLRAMGEGAIATGITLSYSQALDEEAKDRKRAAEEWAKQQEEARTYTDRLVSSFGTLSNQLTNLSQTVGGFAGKLLGIMASLSSGAGGVVSGVSAWKNASGTSGILGTLGKFSAGLGIVGSAIGAVGGLIGGIKSLFGGKSKEEKAAEEAKRKQAEADAKAAKEEAARAKLEGLKGAQSAAESLMGRMGSGDLSESLQAALGSILGSVQDALLKNGLGFMATGGLRDSKAFGEAQGMSGDLAGVVRGMRQGGAVDSGLLAAGGVAAKELQAQAVAAAKEAGATDQEAQKAGFGAVSDLLREQLNASIQSGKALDENTKAMIEEARKNGIEILADPQIESLGVQKEMLGELKRMGSGGYRPPDESFARGTRGLRVLRSDMIAKMHAGEGMMVIPKDEMARMGYAGFNRGSDNPDERMGRVFMPGGGAAGSDVVTTPGASSGSTAYGGPSSGGSSDASSAMVVTLPDVNVTFPAVTVQDNAQIRTADSVRAMENLTAKAIPEIIRQNTGGVQSYLREMIQREIRAARG